MRPTARLINDAAVACNPQVVPVSWKPASPPSGGTPTLRGAVIRHLLFVLLDALQVDKKDQLREGCQREEGGVCVKKQRQVRHRSLVSAIRCERTQSP